MEKIKVTKELKEEFKKTDYGKKCYKKYIISFILLSISCLVSGFLVGYQETGNYLFEHQNVLIFVCVLIIIFTSEMIGRYGGALEHFILSKGKKK